MGRSNLRRKNYLGPSLGAPIAPTKIFFFANSEPPRPSKADSMMETVPTAGEIGGDFSMSGTTIYNPFSAHANPNFNPAKPISPGNPQVIRDPFPNNKIPTSMLST